MPRARVTEELGNEPEIDGRRLRVRKAQRAFRERHQAYVASLEQKAETLERVVAEMCTTVISLSDSLLSMNTEVDTLATAHLMHTTLKRFRELTRVITAMSPSKEESPGPVAASDNHVQNELVQKQAASGNASVSAIACHNPLQRRQELGSYLETVETLDASGIPLSLTGYKIQRSFSSQLFYSTLKTVYRLIADQDCLSTGRAARMFRYMRGHKSQSELLNFTTFTLRQLTSSGAGQFIWKYANWQNLPVSLQDNNFLQSPDLSTENLNLRSLLCAFYDSGILARQELSKHGELEQNFLDAGDVEFYLRQQGALYIDHDTIVMSMYPQHTQQTNHQSDQKNEELRNLGMTTIVQSDQALSSQPNVSSAFDFNSLLPLTEPAPPRVAVTLSVPTLLAKLETDAVCLGNGPAYERANIDAAIVSSVVRISAWKSDF